MCRPDPTGFGEHLYHMQNDEGEGDKMVRGRVIKNGQRVKKFNKGVGKTYCRIWEKSKGKKFHPTIVRYRYLAQHKGGIPDIQPMPGIRPNPIQFCCRRSRLPGWDWSGDVFGRKAGDLRQAQVIIIDSTRGIHFANCKYQSRRKGGGGWGKK